MADKAENLECSTESHSQPLKVLVVDDSVSSARTMGWAIEIMGHEVRLAHDGADALAAALDYMPQIILLDLSLPGLDGYQLCRIMRAEHGFENSLFIAQTGWAQPEHRRRTAEAGFNHHLVKPVDIVRLEQILKDYAAKCTKPDIAN